MNTFIIFSILIVFICSCSADEEEASTTSQESSEESSEELSQKLSQESTTESSRESSFKFYTCVACGGEDVITAYAKCRELKSENTRNITEECVAKVLPAEETEGDNRWEHYCQNPEDIDKVYECFNDFDETLNEEDKASLEKFKECASGINEEYCQEQSYEDTDSSDLNE